MLEDKDIDLLESNIGKLDALHEEMSILAKKLPNDGINEFKLGFINSILASCNQQLTETRLPFGSFTEFNIELLPTMSDVTFIAAQYINAMEGLRCEHIIQWHSRWFYDNGTDKPKRQTYPPRKFSTK
jgi:hypothetical protein